MSKYEYFNTDYDETVKPMLVDNYRIPRDVLGFVAYCVNRVEENYKTTVIDIDVTVYHYDLDDNFEHNVSVNILTSYDYQHFIEYYFDRVKGHVLENKSVTNIS